MRPRHAVLLVALAAAGASRADPPGTPQPSRGAPGDIPGRSDALGTGGAKALESRSAAERRAATQAEVVERVEIAGTRRTSPAFVRGHLALAEGEVLTPDALLLSRVRLVQLGAYSRVDVTTEPGSAPGLVVLHVVVEERGALGVTGGAIAQTPVARPYGGLGLTYADAFGLGVGVSLAGAADTHGRWGVRGTLYDPDLRRGERSWVWGLRLLWEDGRESGCATARCDGHFSSIPWLRYRRAGGEADVGVRAGAFSRFLLGWRLELLSGASDPGVVAAARPVLREGRSRLSAIVLEFDEDSRTDAFLPQAGSRLQASATIGTAALGSDYEYSRFLVQGERWFPQGGGRALRIDAAAGLVQGEAPLFDRFYAADWSYFSIGLAAPRVLDLNFSPDARYDVLLLVAGGEYDLPLWSARGKIFRRGYVDLGIRTVYTARAPSAARSLLSQVPVSFDLGVRVETPAGIFGIGLGYVIDQVLKAVPLHVPGVQVQTR